MGHQCLKCGILYPEGSTVILRGCPDCRGTRFFYTQDALGADERRRMMNGTELTLREAIEELVQKAKEGTVDPKTDHWVLAGPTPKPVIVDPAIVPPDLPTAPKDLETVSRIREALQEPSNVVVKLPRARKRAKRGGPRWDYVAPEPGPAPAAATPVVEPAPQPEPAPAPRVVAAEPVPAEPAGASADPPMAPTLATTVEPLPGPIEATPQIAAEIAAAIHDEPSRYIGDAERPETIHIAAPGRYEIDVKRLLESSPVVIQKDGTYLIHLASLFESVSKPKK